MSIRNCRVSNLIRFKAQAGFVSNEAWRLEGEPADIYRQISREGRTGLKTAEGAVLGHDVEKDRLVELVRIELIEGFAPIAEVEPEVDLQETESL